MTDQKKLAVNTNEDADVEAHARYTGNTSEDAEVESHARGVNLNTNEDVADDARKRLGGVPNTNEDAEVE